MMREVRLRLEPEVAIKLEIAALKKGHSLNSYCKELLTSTLTSESLEDIKEIKRLLTDIHSDYFEAK